MGVNIPATKRQLHKKRAAKSTHTENLPQRFQANQGELSWQEQTFGKNIHQANIVLGNTSYNAIALPQKPVLQSIPITEPMLSHSKIGSVFSSSTAADTQSTTAKLATHLESVVRFKKSACQSNESSSIASHSTASTSSGKRSFCYCDNKGTKKREQKERSTYGQLAFPTKCRQVIISNCKIGIPQPKPIQNLQAAAATIKEKPYLNLTSEMVNEKSTVHYNDYSAIIAERHQKSKVVTISNFKQAGGIPANVSGKKARIQVNSLALMKGKK